MRTIWKYELEVNGSQEISLPGGAKILTVQAQKGVPCLWVLVDKNNEQDKKVWVYTFGTGHNISDDEYTYIGAYQLHGGDLVFHVFTETE